MYRCFSFWFHVSFWGCSGCKSDVSSFGSYLGSWPMGLLIINFWTFRSNRFWNLSGRPQNSKTNGRFGMVGCQRRHESVGSIEAFVGSVLMDSILDAIFLDRWCTMHRFQANVRPSLAGQGRAAWQVVGQVARQTLLSELPSVICRAFFPRLFQGKIDLQKQHRI